jgi:competence protein ComEC
VAHIVERARQSVRDRILALGQGASADAAARAGVVAALVTGDQNAIAQPDWGVFRITGVAHLMAISGLHITMIAWLAALATGLLWRRAARRQRWLHFNPCLRWPAPHAALVGGLVVALAYATFSGLGVPAQRTVLMLACVTLLRLAGLRWPWWLTWAWACALVLALDPWALTQAGFWLSFVAIGILFITDGRKPERGRKSLKAHVIELLGTQSKVTVALAPLTLILFGQASVVGLLANLAAIPWVTLVVTPTALAGLVWPSLWQVAAWAVVPLMAFLRMLAAWPWAQISVAAAPLLWGVAAALGALLLVLRWPWSWRLAGVPLVLPLLLWQPPRPAPGEMDLLAADIGQGSAILLRTARHTLLYDAGPRYSEQGDAGERVLVPLLRALGERPDLLLLSHRDDDHTGGAASIVAAFPATPVLASIPPGRDPEGVAVQRRCVAGDRWVWDGVAFEVLHPSVAAAQLARSSNAMSCVLRVQARSTAVLFTGDLEAAQEKALLASGAEVRSDVLLVPHHGSKTSSSEPWIEAVAPRFALIQAGYRNRYGHPAESILARYAAARVVVVDTPHCGAIRWDSARPDRVGCERVDQVRYWTHRPR